jgi:hypothetical protein
MMGKLLYLPGAGMQASTDQPKMPEQTLLSSLMDAQNAVQITLVPFAARGDIRAVHCRKALSALERLKECIHTACWFLQEPISQETDIALSDLLSVRASSSYYQLLTPLYRAQEQASLLIDLIDAHRLVCFIPSQQSWQQRRAIHEQYATLERYLAKLSDRLQSLDVERLSLLAK